MITSKQQSSYGEFVSIEEQREAKRSNAAKVVAIAIVIAFVSCGVLGCDGGETEDPNSTESILASFKSFAQKVENQLPSIESDISEPVSFDVQQTNSLVSPYTATITFVFTKPDSFDNVTYDITQRIQADYAFQEGEWTCKAIRFICVSLKGTVKDTSRVSSVNSSVFYEMLNEWPGKTIVELKDDQILKSKDKKCELLRSIP